MGCVVTPRPQQVPIQLAKDPLAYAKEYNSMQMRSTMRKQQSLVQYQPTNSALVSIQQFYWPAQLTVVQAARVPLAATRRQPLLRVQDRQPSTIIARLGSMSERHQRDQKKEVSIKLFGEEAAKENMRNC